MSERSEMLHHESDPAARADRLDRFISGLKALIAEFEAGDKCELDLPTCTIGRLEELGQAHFPRDDR